MFRRGKPMKEACGSCERPLREGQKICACGSATLYMDFAERTQYEVDQWRRYRAAAAS